LVVFARLSQATKDSLHNLWADGTDAGAPASVPLTHDVESADK